MIHIDHDLTEPTIHVTREDDEDGSIILKIESQTETITMDAGRFQGDAEILRDALRDALSDVEEILKDWEDRPDEENDGYVGEGRHGGYLVRLAGDTPEGMPRDDYPSRDIAVYELARLMAEGGYYPNCWYVNDHGNYEEIGSEVGAYVTNNEESGGWDLKPLEGVQYEEGEIVCEDTGALCWPMVVDRDYGRLGLMLHAHGDPGITEFVEHEDRGRWSRADGEDEDQ
jgi:hypothetical protein